MEKREKRARVRAYSEEVVELLEKRGEEKPRDEGRTTGKRSVTEDEEYNKRTRGQTYKRINYNPRR